VLGVRLRDPEYSPPDPDPDPALAMYIYQVTVSKKMFLTNLMKNCRLEINWRIHFLNGSGSGFGPDLDLNRILSVLRGRIRIRSKPDRIPNTARPGRTGT
jgi:hypothetical protein